MPPKVTLFWVFCTFAIFENTFALSRSSRIYDVSPLASRLLSNANYDDYLQPQSQIPDSLQRALQTFRDVEKLPSCNKMAASALLHSCAILEDSASGEDDDLARGPDLFLDEAKSIFATRFAVCEIAEARGIVPPECKLFVPSEQNTRKKGFMGKISGQKATKPDINYPIYESNTEQYLDDCRGALSRSPQLWTSYSNSRQNAVSICHAVRSEIEKDEQLHLHKVLAETTVGVHETLRQSRETAEQATAAFHELVINVRQFHMDLLDEDRERQAEARKMWADLTVDLRGGVEDIMARIRQVGENLQSTDLQVTDSGRQALQVIEGILSTVTTLVNDHSKDIAIISTDAATAREQVRYANELFQQNLVQGIYSMTNSLETLNSLAETARQSMQDLSLETANSAGLVTAIGVQLLAMGEQIQELKSDHQEMRNTVNGTHMVMSELRGEVEATKTAMASIIGFFSTFSSLLERLPAAAWYFCYAVVFLVLLSTLWLCPGGLFLLRLIIGAVTLLLTTIFRNAALILALLIIGGYTFSVEQPSRIVQRWQSGGFSVFEEVVAGVLCACLLSAWIASRLHHHFFQASDSKKDLTKNVHVWQKKPTTETLLPITGERDKKGFWFNDPKSYAKKWAV